VAVAEAEVEEEVVAVAAVAAVAAAAVVVEAAVAAVVVAAPQLEPERPSAPTSATDCRRSTEEQMYTCGCYSQPGTDTP